MDRKTPEPLWPPTEVATYLGVPVQTLYQWRRKRIGPRLAASGGTSGTTRAPSAPGSRR
jgi:transposase-like protein